RELLRPEAERELSSWRESATEVLLELRQTSRRLGLITERGPVRAHHIVEEGLLGPMTSVRRMTAVLGGRADRAGRERHAHRASPTPCRSSFPSFLGDPG